MDLSKKPGIVAIVVAAGRGERAAHPGSDVPKQYRPVGGIPLLARTIQALAAVEAIDQVLPVINRDHVALYQSIGLTHPKLLPPTIGGATRQASCLAGLEALAAEPPEIVLIHDAARPFVDALLVGGVMEALERHDAALPVMAVTDTIKRSADGIRVTNTEDRRMLFAAQTPQAFRYQTILEAHRRAANEVHEFTDDAAIAEWAGMSVGLAEGSAANIKITLPVDFARAERLIAGDVGMETRIGSGYDVHPFGPGNTVHLGGVAIPHEAGLVGHSDADAGLHALTDAIYGAIGEGDIGTHFPPGDPQWRGADSGVFLGHAAGLVRQRGGRIVNLDLTLVCESPKIAPHVAAMRARIAELCGIEPGRVAVKATTNERMGFVGRREGIAALATASVEMPRFES